MTFYSKVCVRDFSTAKIYWFSGRFVSNFKDSQRILTLDTKICACKFSTVKTYWHASRAHANFKDSQRFARRVNRVNNKGPQGAFKIHVCRVMYIFYVEFFRSYGRRNLPHLTCCNVFGDVVSVRDSNWGKNDIIAKFVYVIFPQ